jgi:hypothetical protein
MRGRNRRGPNPLARSYESNGPDVKVRGTAQHIADRYLQLARDAQSSGDPVLAESYFQYAEHYLRIIAAAQEQMQGQYGYRPRQEGGAEDEGEGDEGDAEGFGTPQPYGGGQQPSGSFNGQQHQMHRGANGNAIASDDQPPMFSPPPRERFDNGPRERFDNRNQRFEQRDRDGWNRQNRNDGGNRNDHGRRDNYRRDMSGEGRGSSPEYQGEPRQHQPRGDHMEGGGDHYGSEPRRFQGQHGGEGRSPDRSDRPHRERFDRGPRQPAPEEQTLPSFITGPARPVPVAPEAPAPEPQEAHGKSEPALTEEVTTAPAGEALAAAPRPRRGRPRRVAEPAPASNGETPAASDETNPLAAK